MGQLIPIALMLAGTGASIAGAQQSKSAMNSAVKREMRRQDTIQKQSQGVFNESLGKENRKVADKQILEGNSEREKQYQAAQYTPLAGSGVLPANASSVTMDRRTGDRVATDNQSQAAVQGGLTSWQIGQAIKNIRATQALQQNSNFAQGSARVNQYEIQDAQHKGDTLAALGQLISTAGSVAGVAGAVKPTTAAGGKFVAPSSSSVFANPEFNSYLPWGQSAVSFN